MQSLDQALEGLTLLMRFDVIGLVALGMVLGVVVGALPGLTAVMAVAVLMPISFFIEPLLSIPFLLAITKGAIFGASTTNTSTTDTATTARLPTP